MLLYRLAKNMFQTGQRVRTRECDPSQSSVRKCILCCSTRFEELVLYATSCSFTWFFAPNFAHECLGFFIQDCRRFSVCLHGELQKPGSSMHFQLAS